MDKFDHAYLFCECREALGLTQSELAETLWVGLRSVQHWEMGDRQAPGPVWQLLMLKLLPAHHALARRVGKEWGNAGGKSQKTAEK